MAQASKDKLEELKNSSNHVAQFVDECLVYRNGDFSPPSNKEALPQWADWDDAGCFVWLPELYAEYQEWVKCNGYQCFSAVGFTRKLRQVFAVRGVELDAPFVKRKLGRCVKALRNLTFSSISGV